MPRELTPKQARFIAEYQTGIPATEAAIRAGYSPHSAKHAAYALLHRSALVQEKLAEARQALAEKAEYNGEAAMRECDKGMAFAERTENANAFIKAVELKAKLTGLLREKVDLTVETVDVRDALARARARVIDGEVRVIEHDEAGE